jgi:DNA modification methylase
MNIETQMFCGDSAEELLKIKDNSVDMLCTDPPYGYSFMNKGWDKVLPDTAIWRQCFRVLKPGSFITVMAAPRTDVLWRISRDLEEAGFDLSFSNIEWVYHSGFPKATDISKSIDKRGGDLYVQAVKFGEYIKQVREEKGINITKIDKDLFDGSTRYSWFEGRPAGQNVPTPEDYMKIKEYLELDDRFDFIFSIDKTNVVDKVPMTIGIGGNSERQGDFKEITIPETDLAKKYEGSKAGFQPKPAREIIIVAMKPFEEGSYIDKVLNFEALPDNVKMTYPLIQTPKPAKKEKDFGLSGEEKKKPQRDEGQEKFNVPQKNRPTTAKNVHPTVKPIKLMSYLITLFTRPGDWVLDPFGGSGTTGLACKLLDRNHIYIDFTQEYYDIAEERFNVSKQDLKKLLKEKIATQGELF